MSFHMYSFQPLADLLHASSRPVIRLLLLHCWTHNIHRYVCLTVFTCQPMEIQQFAHMFCFFSLSHSCKEAKTGKEDFAMWEVQTALSSTRSRRIGVVGSVWQLPQTVSHNLCKLRDGPGRWSVLVFLVPWCLILPTFCHIIINSISAWLDLLYYLILQH